MDPRSSVLLPIVNVARALGDLRDRVVFIGGAIAPMLLRTLGFRQKPGRADHVHRWYAPDGTAFDLVPAGEHLGASGQPWDQLAIATAVAAELVPGLVIRHATAPAFLALKWAAYADRGRDDPLASHDLEDVLALIGSRPTIVTEVAESPDQLRQYVREQVRTFMSSPRYENLLAAHLDHAIDPVTAIQSVRSRLEAIARVA